MAMDYDRNDALLHWLFRQTQGDAWFRPNEEHISSGVALRVNDGMSHSTCTSFLFLTKVNRPRFPRISRIPLRKCEPRAF
jgi:hypothetical protein